MQINSHLSVLIHDLAKKYGDKPALTFKKFGGIYMGAKIRQIEDKTK